MQAVTHIHPRGDSTTALLALLQALEGELAAEKKKSSALRQLLRRHAIDPAQPAARAQDSPPQGHPRPSGVSAEHPPARRPRDEITPFDPPPGAVATIEETAHLLGVSRRLIVVYCKHGLIAPAAAPERDGYCFGLQALRLLRRIEFLRNVCGINLPGIKAILALTDELEAMRRAGCDS